ncbi:MAG: Hsp20 family protein [Bacteroidota bacterium]
MFSLIKNNHDRSRFVNNFSFDDVFAKNFIELPSKFAHNTPAVNIKETEKSFELDLAAPGMDKKDFKIELKENLLTISAKHEHKTEEKEENERYTRREFSYQSFSRSFNVAEDSIEKDGIQAKYESGILNVSIPKKQKAVEKTTKQIEIA